MGTPAQETTSQIAYLARVLRSPAIPAAADRLEETARDQGWTHPEFLAAVLSAEAAARESSGSQTRIKAARFPALKSLDEFNFDHQPSLRREVLAHLGTLAFVAKAENVVLLGPPGTGKTHLAIGLGLKAAQHGHRVLFASATEWVHRLQSAHNEGRLPQELAKLRRYPVLVIDEVGYIPFEAEAANLFFQLISSRYEQSSVIVTSNMPFSRWGEIFTDDVIAAAMIDRLVHHAEVISLKGSSYRMRGKKASTTK